MTIGEYIRIKRKEAGLSADELAAKIGKNRATIYRYENNSIEKLPSDVLIPLANALSITPGDLIKRNSSVSSQLTQELSSKEQQLIKKYRKLSPAGKEEVDHYLDFRLSAEAPRVEKDAETSSS